MMPPKDTLREKNIWPAAATHTYREKHTPIKADGVFLYIKGNVSLLFFFFKDVVLDCTSKNSRGLKY